MGCEVESEGIGESERKLGERGERGERVRKENQGVGWRGVG